MRLPDKVFEVTRENAHHGLAVALGCTVISLHMRTPMAFLSSLFLLIAAASAQAGVFDLPSFLEPGRFSAGAEAEIAVSNGTGAAVNLKPRFGLTDFLNVQAIVGTGAGERRFRLGTTLDVEYFPDIDNQPGLASPVTLLYTRQQHDGNWTLSVQPLVYKTFHGADSVAFTPFVALPVGWNARGGNLRGFTQIAFGTLFAPSNMTKVKFVAEAGFNLHQSYSYIAGGVTFFPWGYDWNRKGGAAAESARPPIKGGEGPQPAIERSPQSVRPLQ